MRGMTCLVAAAVWAAATVPVGAAESAAPAKRAEARHPAAKSPRYAAAAAHDAMFGDKTLWPMLTGKEYFLQEKWPKGRLYVWARPGTSGSPRVRKSIDPTQPKNWLENGKPARRLVLDETADLLFPASDEPYTVGFRGTDVLEICRHVTIGSGARFVGGGDGRGRKIHGNVWIKEGGRMYAQGATNFVGERHTFFRNDNVDPNPQNQRRVDLHRCSQYFTFNKPRGVSVEFLGNVNVLDEFRIFACTVIVGRNSVLQPGRNASPKICRGGVLALLDGAYFGSWCNNWGIPDMTVESGTIQGGLKDRPLRRSCTFGLGFKNHTAAYYEPARVKNDHRALRKWKGRLARVPSLVVGPGCTLRCYNTDPDKERLVFSVMPGGIGDKTGRPIRPLPGSPEEGKDRQRTPDAAERYKWFDALPRGLDCFLAKGVMVQGVEFDYFRKGGVMVQDPADRSKWQNARFGPHCMAKAGEMVSRLAKIGKGGRY